MTSDLSADVIVIGSGAGGAAVAGQLARSGRSVIVLEAGEVRTTPRGGHARNEDPTGAGVPAFLDYFRRSYGPQGGVGSAPERLPGLGGIHAVGGALTSWTNNTPTHDSSELPEWLDAAVWAALVDRAQTLLHSGTALVEDDPRTQRILGRVREVVGRLPENRAVGLMPVAARRDATGLHYTAADDLLVGGDEVQIIPGRVARRVRDLGTSVAVDVYVRGLGATETYLAEDVVIAAGTIGSAQLIHASGLDAGAALGSYLIEHVAFGTRIALRDDLRSAHPSDEPGFAVWVPASADHPWSAQITRHFIAYTDTLPADHDPAQTADLIAFCPVEPRVTNRLRFDDGLLDGFGLPTVDGVIELSSRDRAIAADAVREQFQLSAELGEIDGGWASSMVARGGSTHVAGSCRMGRADDGTSVVDPDGRLWRHEHIHVAGNAVLSHANAGNPTLSTVAFALQTADAITGQASPLVAAPKHRSKEGTP